MKIYTKVYTCMAMHNHLTSPLSSSMSVFADGMEYFTHTHTHAKFNLRMRSEYKVHFYTYH